MKGSGRVATSNDKKRLTLTGNKMPENVYQKLEELGSSRKLTPYIVNLIEKEEKMNKLLEDLTIITSKFTGIEQMLETINSKLDGNFIHAGDIKKGSTDVAQPEVVSEGKLDISNNIIGGIEENIEDIDF